MTLPHFLLNKHTAVNSGLSEAGQGIALSTSHCSVSKYHNVWQVSLNTWLHDRYMMEIIRHIRKSAKNTTNSIHTKVVVPLAAWGTVPRQIYFSTIALVRFLEDADKQRRSKKLTALQTVTFCFLKFPRKREKCQSLDIHLFSY